jgi:FkbM family methyltransferase
MNAEAAQTRCTLDTDPCPDMRQSAKISSDGMPSPMLKHNTIQLPDVEILGPLPYPVIYGATHVAAAYCGFRSPPGSHRGVWKHGWTPKHYQFHPSMLIGHLSDSTSDYYWVARVDEEIYLRSHGYKNARAIGLPIIYVPAREVARRPGSLLVMPVHSADYTTGNWKFDEYANEIDGIRSGFSEVFVCVHPSCWRNGYWVDAFKQRGFTVIKGAFIEDRNALERMSRLFLTFEYVTTNGLGSHIAYAAYFGAKVSIFGPYAEYTAQDSVNDPFFREKPYLLEPSIRANSEPVMRQHYRELFCHPLDATQRLEWGQSEVGSNNKVKPGEMRYLFGWTVSGRVAYKFRTGVPQGVKHWAKLLLRTEYRRIERELQRLSKMPPYTPGYTNILGRRFEFRDSVSFIEQYRELFEQEIYRFLPSQQSPVIVDTTPNVGLSVVYFKRLYSQSRIIGFEPNPDIHRALANNCRTFNLQDVELFPQAVGTCSKVLKLDREGLTPGDCDEDIEVPALRLKDFLTSKVDLLKLEIKGCKTDVLRDCDEELSNVNNVFVLYRSSSREPQAVDVVTRILKDAGFRLHIYGAPQSPRPFLWRKVGWGTDMTLKIFGFRQ